MKPQRFWRHSASLVRSFTRRFGKLFNFCQRGPFTVSSALLLGFMTYLLLGPIPGSSDIVSASLAAGLLFVLVLIVLLVNSQGIYARRHLSLTVIPPDTETLSHENTRLVLVTTPLRLAPGTFLECVIDFAHEGAESSALRISGSSRSERRLPVDVSFSHRGSWEIQSVRCAIKDVTGLSRFSWSVPCQTAVVVAPPPARETTLPLISSTQRAGDLVTDALNRHGDPYDIKPYHPSDGIKKIVWKAFAKSGELLSRHPEASMTPEGLVTIFVLARPSDDDICGKVVAYVRALKELNLEVIVGCEGANGRPLAHDAASCKELLIDATWDASHAYDSSIQADARALLDYCQQSTSTTTIRKLLIFCAGPRAAESTEARRIHTFASWIASQNIEPVFCVSEPRLIPSGKKTPKVDRIRSFFVASPGSEHDTISDIAYQEFLSRCLRNQWEVFI